MELQARQLLGARMDSRSVQGKDSEGSNHPRKIQHLPFRGLQREGHRAFDALHARERRNDEDRRGHAGGTALSSPLYCHPLVIAMSVSSEAIQHMLATPGLLPASPAARGRNDGDREAVRREGRVRQWRLALKVPPAAGMRSHQNFCRRYTIEDQSCA